MATHFNSSVKPINTFPPSQGNEITKSYYDFLVGEINRGTMFKSVCRIENNKFNSTSYYLISER
jgi:hypothetical protein